MTVKLRLWMIVLFTTLSLTALAGISQSRAKLALEETFAVGAHADGSLLTSNISYNLQRILISAMDIIVDRGQGTVDTEHKVAIEESLKAISQDIEALKKLQPERANEYDQILDETKKIHGLVTNDLYNAVASRERQETFDKLDDTIDEAGAVITASLQQHMKAQKSSFENITARAEEEMRDGLMWVWCAYGVSVVLSLLYVGLTLRSISRPLHQLGQDISAISEGNTTLTVHGQHRKDEIGAIAKALELLRLKVDEAFLLKRMVDDMPINIISADIKNNFTITYANNHTLETLKLLRKHLPAGSESLVGQSIDIFHKDPQRIRVLLSNRANLPHQAKIKLGDETLDLRVSAITNQNGEYVAAMLSWSIVTQTVKLADDFQGSVGAMSHQLGSSAVALQERATSLHSAIEELSAAALEISKRVHDSLDIVRQAVATGENANSMTQQLSTSAERVSGIVTLIRAIAEKTNLLALNATIESARAGDAGKGFAVVANEVKSLASQTSNAITEISSQVLDMQAAARSTAEAISHMSKIVENVNVISSTIAATVEEQQAATSEISRNISGGHGSSNPLHGTETLTIMGMATQLTDVSSHLQKQCEGFLEKVRAI